MPAASFVLVPEVDPDSTPIRGNAVTPNREWSTTFAQLDPWLDQWSRAGRSRLVSSRADRSLSIRQNLDRIARRDITPLSGSADRFAEGSYRSVRQNSAAEMHSSLQAVEQLRSWLGASYDELAVISGVAKTSFFNWRNRPDTRVRPTTIVRLLRVHAAVGFAVDTLGIETSKWLNIGSPSRRSMLFKGDQGLQQFESEVRALMRSRERSESVV